MAPLVKICGINSAESADAVIRSGADFAGMVFCPDSPRHLSLETARSLADRMRGRVRLVALVADASDETIADLLNVARPDFIQLHGKETPARAAAVRARFGVPLIKAIPIAEAADLSIVPCFEQSCAMFLFDAKAPEGARSGGRGATFDWQILEGRSFSRPWLLAGGLTPGNVTRAVATANAPGVDVSSGVETAPGVKSAELIAAFVSAAHNKMEARA
jgi:phosphoribosylanthranilate isomerase